MARPRKNPKTDFQEKISSLVSQSKEFKNIEEFCSAAHISKGQYNNYQKSGANLPSTQVIKDMANALHVDTAFLVGDTEYKNIDALRMNELSGLKPETCDVLLEISNSEQLKEIFEKIVLDENFIRLLLQTYKYSHSHNLKTTMEDEAKIWPKETVHDPVRNKEMLKFSSSDLFNQILDSVYKSNAKASQKLLCGHRIIQLYTKVYELKSITETEKGKRKLIKYIKDELSYISKYITPDADILKYTPEQIIENIDVLYEQIKD
ncbi:helix-turn-helix domain-containing protein [Butyrivibrio proteoclasticus]|uniref:helix-turn-helix domain-containing protein n=1 Tax=Butyrivibrio proteoclasticus TaxID=43305 RepID=UPI000478E4D0|nr:hypothetical protein [Butyrivibrio proteoclasticus]